jgi:putative ABC transport system permease protein
MSLLLRPLDTVFSTAGLLLWIGMALVAAVAASAIPAQNATRLTVRETLAYDG